MDNILKFLEGKKTIIGAVLYGVSATLFALKVIGESEKRLLDGVAEAIMVYGFYDMVKRGFRTK